MKHEKDRDLHVGAYLGRGKEGGQAYLKEIVHGKMRCKQKAIYAEAGKWAVVWS